MTNQPQRSQSRTEGLLRKTSVFLCVLCGAQAFACTIPVFRFALDRWEADPFRLIIPASWATQPDMIKLLVPLRGNGEANIRIEETTDTNVTEARLLFPHADALMWSGKLDASKLPPLLDSPARQELLKHILAGDSAVWVVCTKDADKAEADRIEKRLRFLEQVATLPLQDPNDPDSQLGPGPPLKLHFSVLRLSLEDPAEKLFAAMLAGPKQQGFLTKGTSFAAAVFGKGRVLGSWPLAQLDDTAIEDASLFLIGRCSCRIKNENPGWDVVLKVDWEHALVKAEELTDNADAAAPNLDERVKELEAYVASASAPASGPVITGTVVHMVTIPWMTVGGVAAAVLCALAGLMLWFKR